MPDKIINHVVIDGQPGKFYAPNVLTGLEETDEITELKSGLNQLIEVVPIEKDISSEITWESGYYTLAGSYNSSTVLRHTQKITVNAGDVFTHGGNETINFRYITAYNGDTAVSARGAESSYHYVVPNGITDIIISDYVNRGDIAIYHITSTTENVLIPRFESIYQGNYINKFHTSDSAKFTNLSVGDVLDLSPLNNAGQHKTLLIDDVAEGESFYINITDGTVSKPWAFLDGDNKILSMADGAEAIDLTIVAPSEAKKLLLQIGLIYYNNAVCIRYGSFDYYDRSTDVKKLNEYTEYKNKLENASNIYGGDTRAPIKSRANLLNLIHFSDIHGNVQNIRRILEFSSMYTDYISDIIHTGDAPVAYYSDTNPFAVVGGDNVLEVIGNHECWIQGDTWPSPYNATAQQVYQKFFAPYIASWGVVSAGTNLCYYYKDYSTAKVRLIVLDALHYDLSQDTWFANTLESARTANLRVVAVTHYPSQTGLAGINCTFNSITQTIGSVATPPAGTQIERMPESAFEAVDTFIANGGEFVCWLSGHTHEDFIGTVNNHTDQIQVIISCANTSNRYSDCARTKNTKSQDLFNVFTIDTKSKLIKIIRVGSTMDKFMRKRETLCINYETKEVISNN